MTDRDRRNPAKRHVKVRADHLPDDRIIPLMYRAEDGEPVRIDRIVDVRETPALKLGGQGTRYTCQIPLSEQTDGTPVVIEREIYLFHDRDKWFVEE